MEEHHISTYLFWKIEFCEAISLLCCGWDGGCCGWGLSSGSLSATNASGDISSAGKHQKVTFFSFYPIGIHSGCNTDFRQMHRYLVDFIGKSLALTLDGTRLLPKLHFISQIKNKNIIFLLAITNISSSFMYLFFYTPVRTSNRTDTFQHGLGLVGWFFVSNWILL